MKKTAGIALCTLMAGSLMASAALAADPAILYHAHNSIPFTTLDPSTEYSNGIMILQNVYETLTHYNSETQQVEPMIAAEWSCNEDATVWTFKLRDDITFHDGCALTSADVKASVERTINLGQGAAYNWDSVESIETNGDYEVIFNLSYSAPLDLVASAGYAAYIFDKDAAEQEQEWFGEDHDAGSGPYMITQAARDQVVLQAYEGYYKGWSDDQYKVVLVKEVDESSARRQLLETGEAQIGVDFSSTDLEALRGETDLVYSQSAESFTNVMAFLNSEKAPCDNADFRKALQYAFPYVDAVEGVMDGNAAYSTGLVTAGLWGHDDNLPKYETDMDKAAECLAASGVDPSAYTLSVTYMTGYAEYASILQLWQSNLKTLGINLELRGMEWDEQWEISKATNAEDRQDIAIMVWWPDYASPNSWFDSLILSEDTIMYNLAYIKDENLDAMISEADLLAATDREKATELYVQVQQQLYDDAYIVQMYDQSRTYILNNGITVEGPVENPAYATAVPYYNIKIKQ